MIHLQELSLDGWISYDQTTIQLDQQGITRIVGKTGHGKSALMEAVYYLLFGKTLRGKDSVNDLVNKVLDNGYDISLKVQVDNHEVIIREVRGRKNKGLYCTKNGTDIRGKTDIETRKNIVELLGISAEDFRAIAFLGQRQTQSLLEGAPTERAKTLVDIFGLTKYDDLATICDVDLKEASDEVKSLTQTLTSKQADLTRISAILEESTASPEDLDQLKSELSTVETQYKKCEEEIDALSHQEKEVIASLSAEEQIFRQANKVQKAKEELKDLTEQLAHAKKQVQSTENSNTLKNEKAELLEKKGKLANNIAILKKNIQSALSKSNTCPVSSQDCPVDVPKNLAESTIKACEQKLKEAKVELQQLTEDSDSLTEALTALEKYEQLQQNVNNRKQLLKDVGDDVNIDVISKNIEKLNQQKTDIRDQKTDKNNTRTRLNDSINNVKRTITQQTERSRLLEKLVEDESSLQDAVKTVEKKIDKKQLEINYLQTVKSLFKKAKLYKIDLVLELLNRYLGEILTRISDGAYQAEFVSQRESANKKKVLDKLSILVSDGYKQIPVELCSGGQSTQVGLAVLLATWKTANSISQKGVTSLWLDEVFGTLDEDIIIRVFDEVVNLAQDIGTTSIKVITHQEVNNLLFDHFWYISWKEGISTISFTEQGA